MKKIKLKKKAIRSHLLKEIAEIYDGKLENNLVKYPKTNGEYWIEITPEKVFETNTEIWGCYNRKNNGVKLHIFCDDRNWETNYNVVEDGKLNLVQLNEVVTVIINKPNGIN